MIQLNTEMTENYLSAEDFAQIDELLERVENAASKLRPAVIE